MIAPDILEIDKESEDGRALLAALAQHHGDKIASAARVLKKLFLLRAPMAPGLRFAGGLASVPVPGGGMRLSNSGTALEITDALASCVGEAVERLSQFERPGDIASRAPIVSVQDHVPHQIRGRINALLGQHFNRDDDIDWVEARCALTKKRILIPADWCLRRAKPGPLSIPGSPLSTGVAAGRDWAAAALRATLELVERDAASLWWIGGQIPNCLSLESGASTLAVELVRQLRLTQRDRLSWTLALTTDLAVPVCAALSSDLGGGNLACGVAARLRPEAAVRAALLEMCQSEIALAIAHAKHRNGEENGLHETERELITRGQRLTTSSCVICRPAGPAPDASIISGPSDAEQLEALLDHLSNRGIDVYFVDLTRADHGIAVAAAISPQLQLMPSGFVTERLRKVIETTGGAASFTQNFALF